MGQHSIMAAATTKFYLNQIVGIGRARNQKIRVFSINDLLDAYNNSENIYSLEEIKKFFFDIDSNKLFDTEYLFKKNELENNINKIEMDFLNIFNKFASDKKIEYLLEKDYLKKEVFDFFALHETRNIEYLMKIKNTLDNFYQRNQDYSLIENLIVDIDKEDKDIILEKLCSTNSCNNNFILDFFNCFYPIKMKANSKKLMKKNWQFISFGESGVGLGGNIVKDLSDPHYIQHKSLKPYKMMPKELKEIISSSTFIFAGNRGVYMGNDNNFIEYIQKVDDQQAIIMFLDLLNILSAYNFYIIENDNQKEKLYMFLSNKENLDKLLELNKFKKIFMENIDDLFEKNAKEIFKKIKKSNE